MKRKNECNPECKSRLKKLLNQKRITQIELSKQTGFTPQYISCIIRGNRPMTISAASAFAKVLGVRQEYLLCEDNYQDINSLENNRQVQSHINSVSSGLEQEFHDSLNNISAIIKQKCVLNGLFCSENDLNDFSADIENYINMRFEKWLLPRSPKCILNINNVSTTEGYWKNNDGNLIEYFKNLISTDSDIAEHILQLTKDITSNKHAIFESTPQDRAKHWPDLLEKLKKYDINIELPSNFPLENIPEAFYYACLGISYGIDLASQISDASSSDISIA